MRYRLLILCLLLLPLISGLSFTPQGDIDLRDIYNITGAPYVNATTYYGDGSHLTGLAGGGDINAVNTNGDYLTGGATSGIANLLLNETKLNSTIELLDSDTLFTNGTGLSLVGDTFSIFLSYFTDRFLQLTGGSMTGDIDMSGNNILNVSNYTGEKINVTCCVYLGTLQSYDGNSISVQPTGDEDDFFSFKTPANRPTIKREGGKFIYIESSNVYDVGISARADDTYSGTLNYEKDNHIMTLLGKNSPVGIKTNSEYVNYFLFETYNHQPQLSVFNGTILKINDSLEVIGIVNATGKVYSEGVEVLTSSSDTNASTACSNGEFLNGDGTCDAGYLDADGVDSDTNTNCSIDDSCSGLAYDSEINKTYVDTQDSSQDACSEITGCIENAITDGNTNWDNSYGLFDNISNFTGTLTNDKICVYDSSQNIINCTYTDQTGAGGNVKSGDGIYTYNDTDTIYFNSTYAGINLEVNGSNYWDNLGSPSDINTGDLIDDGTYRLNSWDNLTGIPHATPSNGDVTHFSLADEIYDWVIGLGYLTSISNIFDQWLNTTSGVTFENVSTKAIYGNGDIDTYINWTGSSGDQLEFFAGGISFIHMVEGAGSGITFNQDSNDIDWRVESNDHTHALAVDGGTNKVRMDNYTNCDTFNTDASGILSCGTDADTTYTAGNKLYLDGTEFNVNNTEINTSIEAFNYLKQTAESNLNLTDDFNLTIGGCTEYWNGTCLIEECPTTTFIRC